MAHIFDRRSFLLRVGATAGIGALGLMTAACSGEATGDSDSAGTDQDRSATASEGAQPESGITDSDAGSASDQAERGGAGSSDDDAGADDDRRERADDGANAITDSDQGSTPGS